MNRKFFSLASLLSLSIVIFSCIDDEKGSSSFEFEGQSYKLSHGVITKLEDSAGGVYQYGLVLLSEEAKTSDGNCDFVRFLIYSNGDASLPDGTYNFESTKRELTFDFSLIGISVLAQNYNVIAGSLVVSNKGRKFAFDLVVDGGQRVTGTFDGLIYR